jgi:hypothetical protein
MSEGDQEWWTVPQAAVWIRTHDLAKVEALGGDVTLDVAEVLHPGAAVAIQFLVKALQRGRVEDGELYVLVRSRGILQGSVERCDIPPSFWSNRGDLQLEVDESTVRVIARRPACVETNWNTITWTSITIAAEDCRRCWPSSAEVLATPLSLLDAFQRLTTAVDHLPWLLTHPDVIVTGLNAKGERVEVDRAVLLRGSRKGNAIGILPDGPWWKEVMLDLRSPPQETVAVNEPQAHTATADATPQPFVVAIEPPRAFLSEIGKRGADARHANHREARNELQRIWATGKYSTKQVCAEEEHQALGIGFDTARKALRGAPNPNPWPAKSPK